MTTPDYITPLEGWRKFNAAQMGSLLMSANHPTPWPTRESPEACCIADGAMMRLGFVEYHGLDEPCPKLHCTCGFYAFKDRRAAEGHDQGHVLARVALWGRVVVHRRGYRAQWLRIEELFLAQGYYFEASLTPMQAALSARYQVPVHIQEGTWISERQNASLSSSLLQNQLQHLQTFYQKRYQPHPISNPSVSSPMPTTSIGASSPINVSPLIDLKSLIDALSDTDLKMVLRRAQSNLARRAYLTAKQRA